MQDRLWQAAGYLLLSMWFALATGLIESAIILFRRYVLGSFIWWSMHTVWMGPIAYVLLFLAPGLALAVAALLAPRLLRLPVAVFVLALLGFGSLVLPFPQIHRYAGAILAFGLAVQFTRVVARRGDAFVRLVRYSTPGLIALVVTLAVGMTAWPRWQARRALADLPAASAVAPNILLIILDTVRASSLGLYGHAQPTTPELERLAGESVVFDWPITTSSWTLPSHGTMFTGRFPHELSTGFSTPLDDTHPVLAERLRAHGYATVGFVANLRYASYETGLARGFIHYEDYLGPRENILRNSWLGQTVIVRDLLHSASVGEAIRTFLQFNWATAQKREGHRKTGADINRDFLDWLDHTKVRPFFVFLNYYDAHMPYDPPSPFRERFFDGSDESLYEGAIAYLDDQLGRLFRELDRRGLAENTVIIVTSDHGEQHGEHGLSSHGNSLYTQLVRVPLLIRYPQRLPRGLRVAEPVSLRDLPATLLHLAGIEHDASFPGRSLGRYWGEGGEVEGRGAFLLSEHSPHVDAPARELDRESELKSLVRGEYHYIRRWDGEEELYSLFDDPEEKHNLADSTVAVPLTLTLREFRAALVGMVSADSTSAPLTPLGAGEAPVAAVSRAP